MQAPASEPARLAALRGGAVDEAGVRDVPIVSLTADVTEEQRALCLKAGMTEMALKQDLAALLERLVRP